MVSKNKYLYIHIFVSIVFFLISAFYGLLLRLEYVYPLSIKYSAFLQAHSHVTFLGWGFLSTISLISAIFLSDKILNSKIIKISYWIMVICLASLLFSFPLQGYKFFSILFLTVFLLTSYIYLAFIYKKIKKINSFSSTYITTGIIYYYISSLAIWAVPIIVAKFGKQGLYHDAVFFYLHFLYNGFFVFAMFGLLIKFFEKRNIYFPKKSAKFFFYLSNIACIPAYALSMIWREVHISVVIIGVAAATIQLISLFYLFQIFKKLWDYISHKPTLKLLLFVVAISYYAKILLQFIGAFPVATSLARAFKSFFIIGYIHLYTLGFMSLFLFLLLYIHTKFKLHKLGLFLFTLGILLSELLLFSQGLMLHFLKTGFENYYLYLLLASSLMPLGLVLVLYNHIKTRNHQISEN